MSVPLCNKIPYIKRILNLALAKFWEKLRRHSIQNTENMYIFYPVFQNIRKVSRINVSTVQMPNVQYFEKKWRFGF